MKEILLELLKYKDEILLLNREKPSWMGCWNGVGGKIEPGETPVCAAVRETFEETGYNISINSNDTKVGWYVRGDKTSLGGMYCYLVDVDKKIDTPIKTRENNDTYEIKPLILSGNGNRLPSQWIRHHWKHQDMLLEIR